MYCNLKQTLNIAEIRLQVIFRWTSWVKLSWTTVLYFYRKNHDDYFNIYQEHIRCGYFIVVLGGMLGFFKFFV
jgi:hypothetical protein